VLTEGEQMKYRFIVPAVFLVLVVLFFAFVIAGVGHGPNPFDFIVYLSFPACFLTGPLQELLGPSLLALLPCLVATLIQYFLIGYFIDRLLARRLRKKLSQDSERR
jgi:hypothetical protein